MKRQVDKKLTKQVRIDRGMHKILKVIAANEGRTIRGLIEESLADWLPGKQDE